MEQLIADELVEVEFDHHRAKMLSRDADHMQSLDEAHSVRLVPSWDTHVMFYHPRDFFVQQEYRTRIFRQIQGIAPVLLLDGTAAGTWEKARRNKRIELIVRPFEALSSAQKHAVEYEAGLMQKFFGTSVRLSFRAQQMD